MTLPRRNSIGGMEYSISRSSYDTNEKLDGCRVLSKSDPPLFLPYRRRFSLGGHNSVATTETPNSNSNCSSRRAIPLSIDPRSLPPQRLHHHLHLPRHGSRRNLSTAAAAAAGGIRRARSNESIDRHGSRYHHGSLDRRHRSNHDGSPSGHKHHHYHHHHNDGGSISTRARPSPKSSRKNYNWNADDNPADDDSVATGNSVLKETIRSMMLRKEKSDRSINSHCTHTSSVTCSIPRPCTGSKTSVHGLTGMPSHTKSKKGGGGREATGASTSFPSTTGHSPCKKKLLSLLGDDESTTTTHNTNTTRENMNNKSTPRSKSKTRACESPKGSSSRSVSLLGDDESTTTTHNTNTTRENMNNKSTPRSKSKTRACESPKGSSSRSVNMVTGVDRTSSTSSSAPIKKKTSGGSTQLSPHMSIGWTCTCGCTLAPCMKFCGMCRTPQHWTCPECHFDQNLAVFKYCGGCSEPQRDLLPDATATTAATATTTPKKSKGGRSNRDAADDGDDNTKLTFLSRADSTKGNVSLDDLEYE